MFTTGEEFEWPHSIRIVLEGGVRSITKLGPAKDPMVQRLFQYSNHHRLTSPQNYVIDVLTDTTTRDDGGVVQGDMGAQTWKILQRMELSASPMRCFR